MREILFRGKRVDNGEWVYGNNFGSTRHGRTFKLEGNFFTGERCEGDFKYGEIYGTEVIPETKGLYTGLTDKNGVKIFEGDIVKKTEGTPSVKKVEYDDNEAAFVAVWGKHYDLLRAYTTHYGSNAEFLEVIGNVYDNPELLKGEENHV